LLIRTLSFGEGRVRLMNLEEKSGEPLSISLIRTLSFGEGRVRLINLEEIQGELLSISLIRTSPLERAG